MKHENIFKIFHLPYKKFLYFLPILFVLLFVFFSSSAFPEDGVNGGETPSPENKDDPPVVDDPPPSALPLPSSNLGGIRDQTTKLILESVPTIGMNGVVAATYAPPCYSSGDPMSCATMALAVFQSVATGVSIYLATNQKDEMTDSPFGADFSVGQDHCFTNNGQGDIASEDCSNMPAPQASSTLSALSAPPTPPVPDLGPKLTAHREKLEGMGFKQTKSGQLVFPDGRILPKNTNKTNLKKAGFNEEEIQDFMQKSKEVAKLQEKHYKKIKEKVQKDLKDGKKVFGYSLSDVGFKSTSGRRSRRHVRPSFSKNRAEMSSLFKNLLYKDKGRNKKTDQHQQKLRQFERTLGQDKIGISVDNIFFLIHRQYRQLTLKHELQQN